MKKLFLLKKPLALLVAMIIAFNLPLGHVKSSAVNNYSDAELARAVTLGFGEYQATNPQVTYAQFMDMLDSLVELSDKPKLSQWKQKLPDARQSDKIMTRYNGMLAIMYVADFLGEKYTEFNADWVTIHEKIVNPWNECVADYEIWGDWPSEKVNSGFANSSFVYDWVYSGLAYFYSFGRMSVMNRSTIFDYNIEKNSMRPADKLTYKEALLAVLRLYESVTPNVSERYATAEDQTILRNAKERKQAILNSPTTVKVTGTSYYVSNEGNDSNNGLSPETAWATMDKVNSAPLNSGDGVFFRRGDLWRGKILRCKDGVTYSAYGAGEKPRIYGSWENSSGADKWKLIDGSDNIWVYYKDMPFCGYMVFNDGKSFAEKKWVYWNGTQYVKDGTDEKFNVKDLNNLEYFNEVDLTGWNHYVGSNITVYDCTRTGKLYLRCDQGNPGEIYSSIEISPINGECGFVLLSKNNLIDNLCFRYGGNCAVMGSGNIQYCEFAYLGGANFGFYTYDKSAGGAGGGINVGRTSGDAVTIQHNYIHESYDEGITIESGWNGEYYNETFDNINIKDNLFEKNGHDCWISCFMDKAKGIIFSNITYEGNYFMYSGYPSGSSSRKITPDKAGIALNDREEINIDNVIVKNNTFYVSRFSLVYINGNQDINVKFSGNTYVPNNNAVFVARGTKESEFYYLTDSSSPMRYLNDSTATTLPASYMPSVANDSATVKVGEKLTIPLKNVNSITKVTYQIPGGSSSITVSSKGIVTAKKAGKAKISVTFSNGINKDITQVFTVIVKKQK